MNHIPVIRNFAGPKLAPALITLGDQVYQTTVKYFYNNPHDFSE